MNSLKNDFLLIFKEQRGLFVLMMFNFLFGLFILVFSLFNLNPEGTVVKIGYGDIGGYRDGTWVDMLVFPVLAVLFGVLHNFLSLRIFEKYGGGVTKVFVFLGTFLLFGTLVVFLRLLGEG